MYEKIIDHVGHEIEVVTYADGDEVNIECIDCYIVLVCVEKGD